LGGQYAKQTSVADDGARESEERYRLLFQSAPVPMIERDVSEMKAHLVTLRQSGVSDLRTHFRHHPEEIGRCLELVKTVDCKDAFLRLLETRPAAVSPVSPPMPATLKGCWLPQTPPFLPSKQTAKLPFAMTRNWSPLELTGAKNDAM